MPSLMPKALCQPIAQAASDNGMSIRSSIRRFASGFVDAEKRASDMSWKAPGGNNAIWPDPPKVEPPGGLPRPRDQPTASDERLDRRVRVLVMTSGIALIAYCLIVLFAGAR